MKNKQRTRSAPRNVRAISTRLLAGAMALSASSCKESVTTQAPPPLVQVMEVAKKKIARSTTFIGKLDSPQNVEIRARVEAFVEKVLFQEGSEVKAGDPLFELSK